MKPTKTVTLRAGEKPDPGQGVHVRNRRCPTCIYNPASGFNVAELENDVRDRHIPQAFSGFRECHHGHDDGESGMCCRGFFDAHNDRCMPLRLAAALGGLIEVKVVKD